MHKLNIKKYFIITLILSIIYILYNYNYKNQNTDTFIIEEGENVSNIAFRLEDEGYIKSQSLFKVLYSITGNKNVSFGNYNLYDLSMIDMIKLMRYSKAKKEQIVVTIPEGFTNEEIALRVQNLLGVSASDFLKKSKSNEGYLFPETYFFDEGEDIDNIIKKMRNEFELKVGAISKNDVILASIIEAEGKTENDMKMISGILKKRMSIGMPLQVDVATSTYREVNLPDSPINNPGLTAIRAVFNPIESEYLYYITGNDGNFYYAKTFLEHRKNILKYLK